ncbi:MAG TPA: arginine--tRNA ligase, partial [Acetobacteraceae bacterium]|nr:arginine--tRNA ligase [Acetobacteraceae bacterium]
MPPDLSGDLFAKARAEVLRALHDRYPDLSEEVTARVEVSPARAAEHGDMASNAALASAGALGRPPREIAGALCAALSGSALFAAAAPAGPGFVNLRLRPEVLRGEIGEILRAGGRYGESARGAGRRVNVEYVSANPTGPMHIGHCRGAVVGDALANLLAKAGYDVTKEYYVNDAGAQVEALAWAAYWRYLEARGKPVAAEAFSKIAPGGLQY